MTQTVAQRKTNPDRAIPPKLEVLKSLLDGGLVASFKFPNRLSRTQPINRNLAVQPFRQHRYNLRDLGDIDPYRWRLRRPTEVFPLVIEPRFEDWNCRLGFYPEPSYRFDGGNPDDSIRIFESVDQSRKTGVDGIEFG